MNRTHIINDIISIQGYKSYLEIGIFDRRRNFDRINCQQKTGVDPALRSDGCGIHGVTSDIFFQDSRETFDLIFIDGDHSFNQCAKDVNNALLALNPGGCVVMHDCIPLNKTEAARIKPDNGLSWCGGVYAVYMLAVQQLSSNEHFLLDIDHGIAVLKPKSPAYLLTEHYCSFEEFQENLSRKTFNVSRWWDYENGRRLLFR